MEGCGLLVGHSGDAAVLQVVPTRNSAASSRLYSVDSLDFLRADRAAEAAGLEVIGVFHSHTHTDPYPSPTDVAQAPDPGWHYAIVSLRHEVPSIRSYRIRQGEVLEEPVLDHR
jgi:proteasome lid subunit RPN8/RPN11